MLPFIGEEKNYDFSQSDSLLQALRIQDSLQRIADSLGGLSEKREDSLKLANQKRINDSLLTVIKQDSLKRVRDSITAVNKRIEDSIKTAQNQAENFVKPIDIKLDFAKALFDKKYTFIDARDAADFNSGTIQGALNIPYHEIEKYKSRLNSLPKDQVYVVFCSAECDVSIDLAYAMAKEGFKKVYIFHGGWDEWKKVGYPAN
jgi:rhodanese-related sulfurtransferase